MRSEREPDERREPFDERVVVDEVEITVKRHERESPARHKVHVTEDEVQRLEQEADES